MKANGLLREQLPIALAGGVLTLSESYRRIFLSALADYGIVPGSMKLVTDPALGAVVLARRGL